MKMTKNEALEELKKRYSTPGDSLYLAAVTPIRDQYRNRLSNEDIRNFLARSRTYTTHFEYKPPVHNPYYIRRLRQMVQVDLTEISKISEDNDGYRFLLVAIGNIFENSMTLFSLKIIKHFQYCNNFTFRLL